MIRLQCSTGRRRACLRAGALTIGFLLSGLALGQTTGSNALTASAIESNNQLTEVVVTAQKRTERIEDVPMAISAISADDLLQNHENYLRDFIATVPGVSIQETGESSQVVIRGLSSAITPTVGITIDDVPVGLTNTYGSYGGTGFVPQLDPSDLERIEVLKGPQGTLNGANSIGGLLRYVTAPPDLTSTFGRAQIDGSTIPGGGGTGFGVRGGANIPLIADTLGIRVSAFHREDPGYIDDPFHNVKNFNTAYVNGGRLDGLWQVTPDLSVRMAGLIERTASVDNLVDTAYSTPTLYYRPIFGDLTHDGLPGTGGYVLEHQLYNATVKYHTRWFDVTSITALGRENDQGVSDLTAIYGPLIPGFFPTIASLCPCGAPDFSTINSRKFTQEVRLASPSGKTFEWLAGVFYTNEIVPTGRFDLESSLATGQVIPGADIFAQGFEQHYHEYAAFADFTYHFTSQFDVQVGARESHNWQDVVLYDATGLFAGPGAAAASKDNSFTYLFSPRFRFSDSLMAYARIASGYLPGGPNTPLAGNPAPLTYGPSRAVNYELGVKASFFDRRATVNTALYDIEWSHVQLSTYDPLTFAGYVFNGGGARSRGVETEINLLPIDSLTLGASASYSDSVLTQSVFGNPAMTGDWLPYGSRWSGSLSAEQRFKLSTSTTGFAGATWAYIGKRYSAYNGLNPGGIQSIWPGYNYTNARMGVRWNNGYTLTAFVNNVTNSRGILSANPLIPTLVETAVITPRTVGLSLMKEFK
jgi:outer membrane receptor protein involved in Fe transport